MRSAAGWNEWQGQALRLARGLGRAAELSPAIGCSPWRASHRCCAAPRGCRRTGYAVPTARSVAGTRGGRRPRCRLPAVQDEPRRCREPRGDRRRSARGPRRRHHHLPALPSAGRMARGGGTHEGGAASRSVYWGRPVPGFGDPARAAPARRPGAGRTRRQPHRPRLHRRQPGRLRRAALRGPASRRLLAATALASRRRRPRPRRGLHRRREPLRATSQPPHARRARRLPALPGRASWTCCARPRHHRARAPWPGTASCARSPSRARRSRPRPRFGHGAEAGVGPYALLGCYHPSQQNTFTGRLTVRMLDDVLSRARTLLDAG